MEPELTAEQACQGHLLTPEDFARMCNEDGSLKSQSKTTTFTLKSDDSKSITVHNTVLQGALVGVVLVVLVLAMVLFRRRKNKK